MCTITRTWGMQKLRHKLNNFCMDCLHPENKTFLFCRMCCIVVNVEFIIDLVSVESEDRNMAP